jgi:phosphomannomutase / phosphoglucomutase
MKESVFRAYDIRGTVGKDFLLDSVSDLAKAMAYFFSVHYPKVKKVVIGHDPRIYSSFIKQELARAFLESGFAVFDIGLCTSPLIYFALHTEPFDAGIMVTASHNKKEDNGIKINVGTHALLSDEIQQIKRYFLQQKQITTSHVQGTYQQYNIVEKYSTFLQNQFTHLKNSSISFVIDCGNGSAGLIVTRLKEALDWKNVHVLFSDPDGLFPNHDPNPHDEKNWASVKKLLQEKKDIAFAIGLDGDADRMSVMTKEGKLLSGDQVLALFVKALLMQKKTLTAVYNVLASEILMSDLARQGAETYLVAVGNPIMRNALRKKNATIGGETSGHFFFADRYFGFDDGIYAMIRFVELYLQLQKDLEEVISEFPDSFVSPEIRIFCPDTEKQQVMEVVKQYFFDFQQSCIDGVRVCFNTGWLIIRPSNTEPVVSIRFEGETRQMYEQLMQYIEKALPENMRHEFLVRVSNNH